MPCNCLKNNYNEKKDYEVPILVPDFIELLRNTPDREKRESVCIDVCLVQEVWYLWNQGIVTEGCCCGHGKEDPYIAVNPKFIKNMEVLGYKHYKHPLRDVDDFFIPKSV